MEVESERQGEDMEFGGSEPTLEPWVQFPRPAFH